MGVNYSILFSITSWGRPALGAVNRNYVEEFADDFRGGKVMALRE